MWQTDQISLRLFIAVCEKGTIARAAEREFIAPSAVSKRLADLKTLVDTALLSRSQRGVRPTTAGEALLKHARLIMRGRERLQAELSEYAAGSRGHVRVLANVSSMVEFLPEALSRFLEANPGVRVDVEERTSVDILRGLEESAADIGISRDFISTRELDVTTYRSDHLALVVPKDHPLAGEPAIGFVQTLDLGTTLGVIVERVSERADAAHCRRKGVRADLPGLRFDFRCGGIDSSRWDSL